MIYFCIYKGVCQWSISQLVGLTIRLEATTLDQPMSWGLKRRSSSILSNTQTSQILSTSLMSLLKLSGKSTPKSYPSWKLSGKKAVIEPTFPKGIFQAIKRFIFIISRKPKTISLNPNLLKIFSNKEIILAWFVISLSNYP